MRHTIKTILTSAMAAVATFFMVVYISCSKDKCSGVVCYNGGTCGGGNCTCTDAFEGTNCQTAARAKFIGNWGVTNTTASITEPAQFSVSVAVGPSFNQVNIMNLHNLISVAVVATISRDTITILPQTVQGKIISGAGYIYSTSVYTINSNISISYTVTDAVTHVQDSETEIWNG